MRKRNLFWVVGVLIILSGVWAFSDTVTKGGWGSIGAEDVNQYDGVNSTFTRLTSSAYTITLHPVGYKVDALMAYGGGVNQNNATITSALTAIGTTNRTTLVLRPGTWTISANVDWSSYTNVTFEVLPGAVITHTTYTVNIPNLSAGPYRIFNGTGVVTLSGSLRNVYAEWWYSGTGSYDTALQAAVNCTGGSTFVHLLQNKTYPLVTGITVKYHRVWIVGGGKNVTTITFTPTTTATAITFDLTGTAAIVGGGIRGVSFTGSGTQVKTAIELVNQEEITIQDVSIGTWTDATYSSVGISSKGKHMAKIYGNAIAADIPIKISQNTNRATEGNIDCDHYWIRDNYLSVTSAATVNSNILVDPGVNLYNMVIDGGAWALGGNGFKFSDTSTTAAGSSLTIRNIRWEQETNAAGYFVHLDHNYQFQKVILDNLYGGTSARGFKFTKVEGVTLRDVNYVGTGIALSADSTTRPIVLQNSFFQTTSTLSIPTTTTKVYDNGVSTTGSVISALVIYDTPSAGAVSIGSHLWPAADDTYYLGKNDDDTPFAWKGLILKDQSTGKYYKIIVFASTISVVDLTD